MFSDKNTPVLGQEHTCSQTRTHPFSDKNTYLQPRRTARAIPRQLNGFNMASPPVFPFGKFKCQPVSAVRDDPAYAHWLMTLRWFREQHPELHAAVRQELITMLTTASSP